jgi:hypothetical protein
VFVPGKLFQPRVMFSGKAGAYPSEVPLRCSSPSLKILNLAENACQGQTLAYFASLSVRYKKGFVKMTFL